MTFGNFILDLRERLQDIRKADASLITLATEDGRRWTSARLIKFANDSILEGMRLIAVYSKNEVLKQLSGDLAGIVAPITFGAPTVVGLIATLPLPTDSIFMIELLADLSKEYHYIKPTEYQTYLSDSTLLGRKDKVFTELYDTTSEVKKIYLIGYTAGEVMTGSYLVARTNYTSSDIADQFFVRGLDDLFLDIAERQARDVEHNWDRSKVLDARIKEKLGLIG